MTVVFCVTLTHITKSSLNPSALDPMSTNTQALELVVLGVSHPKVSAVTEANPKKRLHDG